MKNMICFFNERKSKSQPLLESIATWCAKKGVALTSVNYQFIASSETSERQSIHEQIASTAIDLIVVIGGDGTLLRAARAFASYRKPLLPVGVGELGFLMYQQPETLLTKLDELHRSQAIAYEERDLLAARISGQTTDLVAVNEFVVTSEQHERMAEIDVLVNGARLNSFKGDGIIVSSAMGSTAYNLSAGGPIIPSSLHTLTLTPICPHTFSSRAIVFDLMSTEITLRGTHPRHPLEVVADGQLKHPLKADQSITISRYPHSLRLINPPALKDYFTLLRDKLNYR